MDICSGDGERTGFLYRDPLFERSLEDLRKKGGTALVAAKKAETFIEALMQKGDRGGRGKFRFTRNGEYRIKNCKKIDLGCGYRLVCIKKDQHLVLLYIGTHDDCFRWIERNKGLKYEIDPATDAVRVVRQDVPDHAHANDIYEEDRMSEEYEESLMSQVDDTVLRKIFPGLCRQG